MTSDLKISSGGGIARPTFETDLLPPLFDEALGTTDLRAAWLKCNEEGRAAERAYRAALAKAREDTPLGHYGGDMETFAAATEFRVKPLADEVGAATRRSVRALRALHEAIEANYPEAVESATALLVDADDKARAALADLRTALADRETVARIARRRTDGWASHPRLMDRPHNSTQLLLDDLGLVVTRAFTFNGVNALAEERAALASPMTAEERRKAEAKARAAKAGAK